MIYFVELWSRFAEDGELELVAETAFKTKAEAEAAYARADAVFAVHSPCAGDVYRLTRGDRGSGYGPGDLLRVGLARRWVKSAHPEADFDADWRREMANEAGMCLGIDAYNDVMGNF